MLTVLFLQKRLIADIVGGSGVLVLTYEGLRVFRDFLLPYQWEYVVLDEGHKIRNPDAEVTLVCKQVCAHVCVCVCMCGVCACWCVCACGLCMCGVWCVWCAYVCAFLCV